MLSHPLTYFEIKRYYQKKTKFKGVYSRNRLPNIRLKNVPIIKDGLYIINLDVYKSIGSHWIALCLHILIDLKLYIF